MQLTHTTTRAPRRHNVPLLVRLDGVRVRTRNLSITGIFVETEQRPTVGETCELMLVWGEEAHCCQVRIVRHAMDGIGVTYEQPDSLFSDAVAEILADDQTPSTLQQHS